MVTHYTNNGTEIRCKRKEDDEKHEMKSLKVCGVVVLSGTKCNRLVV